MLDGVIVDSLKKRLEHINILCYKAIIREEKFMKKSMLLLGVCLTVVATSMSAEANPLLIVQQAQAQGKFATEGEFTYEESSTSVSGKIWCSQVQQRWDEIKNRLNDPNVDIAAVSSQLRSVLPCISISSYKQYVPQLGGDVVFSGNVRYPNCNNGSTFTLPIQPQPDQNGTVKMTCSVDGNQQRISAKAVSEKGQLFAEAELQYDIDKVAPSVELEVLGAMARKSVADPAQRAAVSQKIHQLATKYSKAAWQSAHLLNLVIYRPDQHPLVKLVGNPGVSGTVSVFNSMQKPVLNVQADTQGLQGEIRFPQTADQFISVNMQFADGIMDKYNSLLAQLEENGEPSMEQMAAIASLFENMKFNSTIYSLHNTPFAKVSLKTRDKIVVSAMEEPKPEDIVDRAELTFAQQSGACPIRSVRFSYQRPQVMTICEAQKCSDVPLDAVPARLMPCFDALQPAAMRFGEEGMAEFEALDFEKMYIPFVSEGYHQSMERYTVNEIENTASMVAIMAQTTENATSANLASLKGTMGYKKDPNLIDSDDAIQATKDGVVTVRIKPERAADLMPQLQRQHRNRIVSGCTPNTNVCVFRLFD